MTCLLFFYLDRADHDSNSPNIESSQLFRSSNSADVESSSYLSLDSNSADVESSQLSLSSNSADVIFSQLSCGSSRSFNSVDVVSSQLHCGSSSADVAYSLHLLGDSNSTDAASSSHLSHNSNSADIESFLHISHYSSADVESSQLSHSISADAESSLLSHGSSSANVESSQLLLDSSSVDVEYSHLSHSNTADAESSLLFLDSSCANVESSQLLRDSSSADAESLLSSHGSNSANVESSQLLLDSSSVDVESSQLSHSISADAESSLLSHGSSSANVESSQLLLDSSSVDVEYSHLSHSNTADAESSLLFLDSSCANVESSQLLRDSSSADAESLLSSHGSNSANVESSQLLLDSSSVDVESSQLSHSISADAESSLLSHGSSSANVESSQLLLDSSSVDVEYSHLSHSNTADAESSLLFLDSSCANVESSRLLRDSSSADAESLLSSDCSNSANVESSQLLLDSSFVDVQLSLDFSSTDVESRDSNSANAEFSQLSHDSNSAFAESSHSSRDSNSTYIESSFTSDGSYSANIESSLSTHDYHSVDVESDPEVALVSLGNLISNVLLPSQLWCLRKKESLDGIMIYKASEQASPALVPLKITHCITIKGDLSWELSIHGYLVNKNRCRLLSEFPDCLTQSTLHKLLSFVEKCKVCPGHPDLKFVKMVKERKGVLLSQAQTIAAQVDDYSPVFFQGESFMSTVRISTCELLNAKAIRCAACKKYRNSLRSIYHRWSKQKSLSPSHRESTKSKTNIRWLNTPQKAKRYSKLRSRFDVKLKEVERLKEKINKMTDGNHVILSSGLESDFCDLTKEMSKKIAKDYPADSFKRLFWEQQLKAISAKNKRQVRWHPAIIKWCLHMKFISGGGYHALRKSGLIVLPSERTLRDYTHSVRAGIGFLSEVDAQLMEEARVVEEVDRFVVLSWDEIKIKEGLVYDKHNCELIGFTNIGEVNDMLDKVERQCLNDNLPSKVCTHILLFMVRGMFSSLQFPYAHFATRGISADALYPIVWEAVNRLESSGLNVIAFCCDGASPNRKFYKMHRDSSKELVYKTPNPYCNERDIFFICDVPHLLKTTRNCWSNSFAHKNSRALWVRKSFGVAIQLI